MAAEKKKSTIPKNYLVIKKNGFTEEYIESDK